MIIRELTALLRINTDKSSVSAAETAIGTVKKALLGLAAGYGIHEAFEYVRGKFDEMAKAASDVQHLSEKTGITTQKIQELEYAANMADVSSGSLQQGLVHLARSAQQAATQGGQAAGAYARLGVRLEGADGKLRPMGELLADVAQGFQKMPAGAEKMALATEIFSRSGAELLPLFNDGAAGIDKMGLAAQKAGAVMSDSLLKQGVRLDDAMKSLGYSIKGLVYAVLGPFMERMAKSKERLVEWLNTHRHFIALKVHQAFNFLSGAIHGVLAAIKEFPRVFAIAGAALFAVTFPITALIAALALLAEDLYGYFGQGKSKSITFLVLGFFELMRRKVMGVWKDFKENPFKFLYDHAKKVFDDIVDLAKGLPGRLADSMAAAQAALKPKGAEGEDSFKQSWWNPLGHASVFNWLPKLWGAEIGMVGNAIASLREPSISTGIAGNGYGGFKAAISIGQVNVTAPAGADAKQFAQEFRDELHRIADDNFDLNFGLSLQEAKAF